MTPACRSWITRSVPLRDSIFNSDRSNFSIAASSNSALKHLILSLNLQNIESVSVIHGLFWMQYSKLKFSIHCLCPQRLDIAKLNDLINKAEENMVQLRKRYESAVQERNDM